jgi:putative hemolysin
LMEIRDKNQVDELPNFDLSEVQVEDLSNSWSEGENTQIANPASENCVNLGGELEIVNWELWQSWICKKDWKECEEWALFRWECSFDE